MKRLCAFLIFTAVFAFSTTVIPMSVERLTHASTHVVEAKAADVWTEWNREHTLIYTITRFQVLHTLKGTAADTILVKQMGGRSEGLQQKVSGVTHWSPGDEAVLFLRPSQEREGAFAVTGLMQGNFRIQRHWGEATASNGVPEAVTFDPTTKATGHFTGRRIRLRQLESEVLTSKQKEVQ